MIRGIGVLRNVDLFSNFKHAPSLACLIEAIAKIMSLSGPILVSRTGDVGWTKHKVKVSKWILIRIP